MDIANLNTSDDTAIWDRSSSEQNWPVRLFFLKGERGGILSLPVNTVTLANVYMPMWAFFQVCYATP